MAYQSHYEKSYALVIGIDAYQALPPLETAVRGAETVARILEENLGFEVTLLRDAEGTRDAILAHLSQEFADTQPDDRLLFYFAGHGLTRRTTTGGEVGFLAPYGVEVGKYHQAIEMEYLVDRSKFFPAKHTLFVLDACFSGLAVTRAPVSERLLEDLMTRRAVQAIAAGQQDQEVADRWGPAGQSIFTGLLLDRLEQRGGLLTGNELGLYLQRQVGMYTKSRQTPHYGQLLGSQGGDFVFWAEEIVVELPAELRAAIESPLAGVREGAVRELAHLLEGSMPEMAQRAHEALERLAEDDSRSVSTAALEALGTPPAAPVEVAPPPEAPPAVPEVVREEPPSVEPAPAAPPAPVEEARPAAPAPRERPKRTGLIVGGLGAVGAVAVVVALLATGALGGGGPAAPAEEEAEPTYASGIIRAEEEATPAAEEAAAPAGEVIRVYASWPLQGSMLPIGEGMRNAANLALDHYLEDHPDGPGGYGVEFIFNDDASPVTGSWDGTVEAEIARKCVNDDRCLVYFGTYNSGAAIVSMPITNEAGIAQISPANTYPGLTFACPTCGAGEPDIYRPSGEQTYFRINGNDYYQGLAAASWARCLGHEKIFILDDRQLYGKGVADAVEAYAAAVGVEVVGHEGVESTDTDFYPLIVKIMDSGATLVYGGFVVDSGGAQVVQQMATQGLFDAGIQFMGPDGLVFTELIEYVGGPEVIGDGNVLLTFPGLVPTQVRDISENGAVFYSAYEDEYGELPDVWDAYAYQATLIILDSIERAAAEGPPTRESVLAAMKATDFEGVTGHIQFDENGDPIELQIGGLVVRDGEIIPLEPISDKMHEACP